MSGYVQRFCITAGQYITTSAVCHTWVRVCLFNYTYVRIYVCTCEQYGYAATSPFPLDDLEFGPGTQLYICAFFHAYCSEDLGMDSEGE